ncbi:hypothetical protein ABQ137_08130 [Xanthomonas sp. WHRI 8393]|uniref:hypothetical protein n=1 Tax=Xanthomonas sp. WHRI 8393 TaxID=3161574 RepID=UPI0032E888F9
MSDEANNALSEFKNELKGAINVRLRSPVAGLFALSWLLINHRVVFVLFSDLKVGKKFNFIDDEIYGTPGAWISMNVVLPLMSTAFFLLVMPWVSALVHRWNLWHHRRQRAIELRSDGLSLLTEEQTRDLRGSLAVRDQKIFELKAKVGELAARSARYASMSLVLGSNSSDEISEALRSYLILHRFSLELANREFVRQIHTFDDDGFVETEWKQGRDASKPDTWSVNGPQLTLFVGNEVYFSADFNGRAGCFEGVLNGFTFVMKSIPRK